MKTKGREEKQKEGKNKQEMMATKRKLQWVKNQKSEKNKNLKRRDMG